MHSRSAGTVLCRFDNVLTPLPQQQVLADMLGLSTQYRILTTMHNPGTEESWEQHRETHALLQENTLHREHVAEAAAAIPLRDGVHELVDTVHSHGWRFAVFSPGFDTFLAAARTRVNAATHTAAFTCFFDKNGAVNRVMENPAWRSNACGTHPVCPSSIVQRAEQCGPVFVVDSTVSCALQRGGTSVLFTEKKQAENRFSGRRAHTLHDITAAFTATATQPQ